MTLNNCRRWPKIEQYHAAKERHPNMLVLFRVGDFFELFGADAETASKILGLTLTSRDKTTSMAGFPHHALESYLSRLIKAGQRVAICDQVDDPPPGAESERIVVPEEDGRQPGLFDEIP
jgi:DNA mismatch repair protein MutS